MGVMGVDGQVVHGASGWVSWVPWNIKMYIGTPDGRHGCCGSSDCPSGLRMGFGVRAGRDRSAPRAYQRGVRHGAKPRTDRNRRALGLCQATDRTYSPPRRSTLRGAGRSPAGAHGAPGRLLPHPGVCRPINHCRPTFGRDRTERLCPPAEPARDPPASTPGSRRPGGLGRAPPGRSCRRCVRRKAQERLRLARHRTDTTARPHPDL